jgi:hypothetical protein|tara:strand:+ start:152 stop:412 length:261 start_codon:yes stop_codon:yes gene_type:complete
MTNIQVIKNWISGKSGQSGSMRSADGKLFSYELQIGDIEKGIFQVYDYDINTIEKMTGYRSMTTRQHLGLVTRILSNAQRIFEIQN